MPLKDSHLDLIAQKNGADNMQALLKELYSRRDMSLEKCSEMLDLSIYLVRKLLQRYGISERPGALVKSSISLTDLKKHTLGELALKHHTSRSTIWRIKQGILGKTTPKKPAAPGGGS